MKIEFGAGETPTKPDFKTCDIRDVPGVDFVCAAWDIDKLVGQNSVDEIFSRHFFEHLTFAQGEKILDVWRGILKPGGKCEMILPNMTFHIDQWINRRKAYDITHAKARFWGWQRGTFDDAWDVHKSGYDAGLLKEVLKKHQFEHIEILSEDRAQHLHTVFYKRR